CDAALELDPKNEKSFFRRGLSEMSMSSFDEAIKDFEEVVKLNPSNDAVKQHFNTFVLIVAKNLFAVFSIKTFGLAFDLLI
ncbi:unnamed protein product, partial [Rotaria sp. Silwood2]